MHCLTGLLKKRKKAKTEHSGSKPKQGPAKATSSGQAEVPHVPSALLTHSAEEISAVNTAAVSA